MTTGSSLRRLNGRVALLVAACLVALAAMYWGETAGRSAGNALSEWIASVSDHGNGPLAPADEGRLVRVVGTPAYDGPLVDTDTGVAFDAIAAWRRVETNERYTAPEGLGTPQERIEEGWGRIGRYVIRREGGIALEANPVPPFRAADLGHDAARIGTVPVTPALAFALRTPEPQSRAEARRETILAALRARFPDRSVSFDGSWYVVAAAPDRPTIGDVRIQYTVFEARALSTVVGLQRDGRLDEARVSGTSLWPRPGQEPVSAFAPPTMRDAASDAVFWARFWALFVVAGGMMVLYLGWQSPGAGTGAGWALGLGTFAAADDGPVGAVVAIFMAIMLLPFAVAALPFTVALGFLAWWMAQSPPRPRSGLPALRRSPLSSST